MLAIYIFCAICIAGVAFLGWCFVAFYREGHRTRSTYSVGVYPDDWQLVAGHHCVVSISEGKRASGLRVRAQFQSGRSAASGAATFIPMTRSNSHVH